MRATARGGAPPRRNKGLFLLPLAVVIPVAWPPPQV